MRISDWSSDVCSSDLLTHCKFGITQPGELLAVQARLRAPLRTPRQHRQAGIARIGADIRNQRPPFRFMARLACNAPRSRIVHADDGDHGANATRHAMAISLLACGNKQWEARLVAEVAAARAVIRPLS